MSYRDEYVKLREYFDDGSSTISTGEAKKWGLRVGQKVRITAVGEFNGQETEIRAFTPKLVEVIVSGPEGELDSGWWFRSDELEAS